MLSVCVGIHVHAEPHRLKATLASLHANTTQVVDLLLLPDGPDEDTNAALQMLNDHPQLGTATSLGPAACFNRLVTASQAEVLVLLESGSLVAPRWLEHLLAALAADPHHGLAGPSTNHAWNEQCVYYPSGATGFPDHVRDTAAAIAQIAQAVERRFGPSWRTLQPLHSLADFCYVVRREVVQAIGAADEAYGLGPCWEMDYNIRAARAGFLGVWACAAYVHRAPFTARRAREEARYFETNKQRYQDKFCALRLRGERTAYESHCRGEVCEHFAPAALIPLRLPLSSGDLPQPRSPLVQPLEATPLVSCIMATCNRRDFVLQSIRYFQRQDYPARELIILDDGTDDLRDQIPEDSRIRYVHMGPRLSIGAKRNRGCELAHGSIIAQWDDDDWYAPGRLSAQVAPILAGEADISGLKADVFFDLTRWGFWTCTPELHRRLFIQDVHGGTLVFSRRCWEHLARYPDVSLAEDAGFLYQAMQRGARLYRPANACLFIYLRHAGNSWSFECGQYLDPRGWQRVVEPPLPLEDRAFYAAHSPAVPTLSPSSPSSPGVGEPVLVSCIMPTADRRALVPQAIRYFLRQDYPNRELIVLDDGADAVADLIPPDPKIRYVRLAEKSTLGRKRNMACELARGEIICHWDDDDWMANWRLSYQVRELLLQPSITLCGLAHLLFYDPRANRGWEYLYPSTERPWVCGNTFCYPKRLWQHRFPDLQEGEDTVFVWSLRDTNVLALLNRTFYVATVHPRNASPKKTDSLGWHAFPVEEIRRLLREDWSFYKRWPQSL